MSKPASGLALFARHPGDHLMNTRFPACLGILLFASYPLFAADDDKDKEAAEIGKQLQSNDFQARNRAADRLAKLGAPAVPVLKDALKDAGARSLAAEALGKIGPEAKDAVGPLVDGLKTKDAPEYASAAAIALGKIGAPAVPALRGVLKDETDEKVLANA